MFLTMVMDVGEDTDEDKEDNGMAFSANGGADTEAIKIIIGPIVL